MKISGRIESFTYNCKPLTFIVPFLVGLWVCTLQWAMAGEASARTANRHKSLSSFAFVFVDAKTEAKWGRFPYDRARLARALAAARKAKAKGVVLKFFLDRLKSREGDRALVVEMKKIPTFLQARLDFEEEKPEPLLARFALGGLFSGESSKLLTAPSGWIPHIQFQEVAAGVGFVDVPVDDEGKIGNQIPMAVQYRGHIYSSLWLLALDHATGQRGAVGPREVTWRGLKSVVISPEAFVSGGLSWPPLDSSFSMIDLVEGRVSSEMLRDRVVVIGLDSDAVPTVQAPEGPVGIHRRFGQGLLELERQFLKAGVKR